MTSAHPAARARCGEIELNVGKESDQRNFFTAGAHTLDGVEWIAVGIQIDENEAWSVFCNFGGESLERGASAELDADLLRGLDQLGLEEKIVDQR